MSLKDSLLSTSGFSRGGICLPKEKAQGHLQSCYVRFNVNLQFIISSNKTKIPEPLLYFVQYIMKSQNNFNNLNTFLN